MTRRARPPRAAPSAPPVSDTWQAELAPVAVSFTDDASARPALLLVVSIDNFILHGDVVAHPSTVPAEIAAILAEGVARAIERVGRAPRRLEVRDGSVAATLAPVLREAGVAVHVVERLDAVDRALKGYDEMVLGRPERPGPRPRVGHPERWAGWRLPSEQLARLFAASAAYHRAAPWQHIFNEDVFRAKVKGGGSWSATVLGYAGEEFGLVLYERPEDLESVLMSDIAEPQEAFGRIHGGMLSLSFGKRTEMSKAAQKEILQAHWEVAGPNAYPVLFTLNTPGGGITERQMEDLIALLTAVPAFAAKHHLVLSGMAPAEFPLRWRQAKTGVALTFEPGLLA